MLFSLLDTDGSTRLASSPWPAPKGNKPATITWVASTDGTYYLSSGDYHNWGKQREYTMIMSVRAPIPCLVIHGEISDLSFEHGITQVSGHATIVFAKAKDVEKIHRITL